MKYTKLFLSGFALAVLLSASVALAQAAPSASQTTPFLLNIKLAQTIVLGDLGSAPRSNLESSKLLPHFTDQIAARHHSLSQRLLRTARPESSLQIPVVPPSPISQNPAGLAVSFHALDIVDQVSANNGKQLEFEPPDQGLCVGNGFILETVNTVLRVFDMQGNPLTDPIDVNRFYGYPDQYDPQTGQYGPSVGDVSCYFDVSTQRWFHMNWTLQVDPDSYALLGPQTLDIAVSQTPDPRGAWNIYRIPSQNDGQGGTPKHTDCPCYSDFPHIGADRYGFYITTNEYPFAGGGMQGTGYNAAQVYAISKKALAQGNSKIQVWLFENVIASAGTPGFTVWPAISTPEQYVSANEGTEFFLSSMAGVEANNFTGFDNRIELWAMLNTSSLDSRNPQPRLTSTTIQVDPYGYPPFSNQKPGPTPLRDCLNIDCLGFGPPPEPQVESPLDSSDTRMLTVWYANGALYGALGTIVNVNGEDRAGVAYYIIQPGPAKRSGITGSLLKQGYVAVANNNIIYPAIAVLKSGKGAMALTLVGDRYYPSAAYLFLDKNGNPGAVQVAAKGIGPADGFGGTFLYDFPRWGDYGAAMVADGTLWVASEYINQKCRFSEYIKDMTCGGTRTPLENWATRISAVKP